MMFAKNSKSWRKLCKTSTIYSSRQILRVLNNAVQSHEPASIRHPPVRSVRVSHRLRSAIDSKRDTSTETNLLNSTRSEHQIAKQDKLKPTFVQHNNKIATISSSSSASNNSNRKNNNDSRGGMGMSSMRRDKLNTMRHDAGHRSLTGNGCAGKMKQHEKRQSVRKGETSSQTYCFPMMASLLIALLAYALQQTVQVGSVGEYRPTLSSSKLNESALCICRRASPHSAITNHVAVLCFDTNGHNLNKRPNKQTNDKRPTQ